MKRVYIVFIILIFSGCASSKSFIQIKIIPESSVKMEEGEITIIFSDEGRNEVAKITKEIKPFNISRVRIPEDAYYFWYFMSYRKGVEPIVWFSGSHEELLITKNKTITIHANDPVNLIEPKNNASIENINDFSIKWEKEEFVDMYFLELNYNNSEEETIGQISILLPSEYTSFNVKQIDTLLKSQTYDASYAVENRLPFIEIKKSVTGSGSIRIRVEAMLIHSESKLRYLTNTPKDRQIVIRIKQ